MEVWDYDDGDNSHERIDNFKLPLSSPLKKFNLTNPLTVQSHHRVGNLTLSYGNLTDDPTPCDSTESQLSSTSTQTQHGI